MLIVARPLLNILKAHGVGFGALLTDIRETRVLNQEMLGSMTEMFRDRSEPTRFRSVTRSFSSAYGANAHGPVLGDITIGLPAFAGSFKDTDLTITFIEVEGIRYIPKADCLEVVLLKTLLSQHHLPDMVVQGMRDVPIGEVVGHPMFADSRSIVRRARRSNDSLALVCTGDDVEVDGEGRMLRDIG